MSTRRLNIPDLGFEVVVVGANKATNDQIAELLEKKIAEEIVDCELCACVGCSEGNCCDHEVQG